MGKKCSSCGCSLGLFGFGNYGTSNNPLCYNCEKELREKELREKELREKELREKELREKELRAKEPRAQEPRGEIVLDIEGKVNFSKTIDKYLATATEKYALQAISVAEDGDIESLQHRLNGNATLLELAALLSHYNVIKELVKRGEDINAITYGTDGDPKNALYLCCAKNNLNMVKYLIDNGANVNVVFGGKMTPLMLSANLQFEELAILLINNGADVNAKDVEGWTALLAASKKGNLIIAKALIGANANINSRSNSGSTALSIAKQYANSDIVTFLKAKGAL